MKKLLTLVLLASATFVYGQHTQTRKISTPKGIAVSASIDAKYISSNRNEVVIDVENEDVLDKVETEVENGILRIRYKNNTSIRGKRSTRVTVYSSGKLQTIKVSSAASLKIESEVETPDVAVHVSSSGKLLAKNIIAERTAIDISSSGRFDGQLTVTNLTIEASSSSHLILAGRANNASLDLSSSANVDLSALQIKQAAIEASSSSKATVKVSGNLTADVSSSGHVYHIGKPENISIDKSSGGQVTQQ